MFCTSPGLLVGGLGICMMCPAWSADTFRTVVGEAPWRGLTVPLWFTICTFPPPAAATCAAAPPAAAPPCAPVPEEWWREESEWTLLQDGSGGERWL